MLGMRSLHARRRSLLGLPLLGTFLSVAACDHAIEGERQLTSLRMVLTSPEEGSLGAPGKTVSPQSVRFSAESLDERGKLFASNATVEAFLVAGGVRLPLNNPCAQSPDAAPAEPEWLLSRFDLSEGKAPAVSLPLTSPAIFGRLTLNIEEPQSRAEGATPPIFFPNPTISQIVKPLDVTAANASFCNAFLGRQIIFDTSASPTGKLVVSSVFQNAVSVSDSGAAAYNSIYIFTFSRPSTYLIKGRVLERVAGAVAKFNGMTQVANPTISASDELRRELVPAPVELTAARRPTQTTNSAENQWLGQYIAAPVRITGIVCETEKDQSRHDNWLKYNTVTINQTGDNNPESVNGCGGVNTTMYIPPTRFNVQFSGKGVAGFDPAVQAGQEMTITGMLQNGVSKSGKTIFWTVVVREESDVCLQPRANCPNAN
jgi:hypothetical protein